jgi:hypothetical protein
MRKVLIAAFAAAALSGCDVPDSVKKQVIEEHKREEAEKKAQDAKAAAAEAEEDAKTKAGLRERTFRPPVPTDPNGNPVTVAAADAGKRVELALDDIRKRVAAVRKSVAGADPKGKGIVEAANDLRLLVKELRGQTDALKRSAADLIPELLAIDYDYRAAADRFRRRAAAYADPQMRDAVARLADDLDWAADDAPRRTELAAQFLAAMNRNAAMLREADLALGDVAALAAILDAGSAPKSVKEKAVELDALLQRFLGLIETFSEQMKVPPQRGEKPPEPKPAGGQKPGQKSDAPVPPVSTPAGGNKAAGVAGPSGGTPPPVGPEAPKKPEDGRPPAPEKSPGAGKKPSYKQTPALPTPGPAFASAAGPVSRAPAFGTMIDLPKTGHRFGTMTYPPKAGPAFATGPLRTPGPAFATGPKPAPAGWASQRPPAPLPALAVSGGQYRCLSCGTWHPVPAQGVVLVAQAGAAAPRGGR